MNPVRYSKLSRDERRRLRNEYVRFQNGKCMYCEYPLDGEPARWVAIKPVDISLYPQGFFNNPIHLQHCHKSGYTEGAVHAYCNAVMWEYDKR